jgi:hypothetical protein
MSAVNVAAAFTRARQSIAVLLTDTCRIRAGVAGTVGVNGTPRTWPAVTATVACNVQGPRSSRSGEIDNTMLPHHHRVKVPVGTVLAESDRIEWVEGGITLEVIGDQTSLGSNSLTHAVLVVEVPS